MRFQVVIHIEELLILTLLAYDIYTPNTQAHSFLLITSSLSPKHLCTNIPTYKSMDSGTCKMNL